MIDAFAERLDAWVVSAVAEVHREVFEVLSPYRSFEAAEQLR